MRTFRLRLYHAARAGGRRRVWAVGSGMLGVIVILTGCASPSRTTPQVRKTPSRSAETTSPSAATPASEPSGWVWQSAIPDHRLLLYYYIPGAPWGFLGTHDDQDLLARIQDQSQQYTDLDPAHPVIAGLDTPRQSRRPIPALRAITARPHYLR